MKISPFIFTLSDIIEVMGSSITKLQSSMSPDK